MANLDKERTQAEQDAADQAELDRDYEQMHGKSEEPDHDQESLPNLEDDDGQDNDESTDNDAKGNDTDDVNDDPDQDAELEDELDDADHDADDFEQDLGTLDDDEPVSKVKLSPEQQKVVNKRIERELRKVRQAESETSELKAQVEMLTRLVTGGAQPALGTQPSVNFQPPAPTKAYEDMSDYERVNYALEVREAQQRAAQDAEVQRQSQELKANAFKTVVNKLKSHLHDPIIRQIHDVDGSKYFSPSFTAALADYPNSASIMRHLYQKNKVELTAIMQQPPEKHIAAAIKYAERYNLERKRNFDKKAAVKKPVPPGKTKSATLPKNTNSGKGVYESSYLEGLTDEQYKKLISKGY